MEDTQASLTLLLRVLQASQATRAIRSRLGIFRTQARRRYRIRG
jgi:hypothetical protein